MLDHFGSDMPQRKALLIASACCRRIWHLLVEPSSRQLVEAIERYADDKAVSSEVTAAFDLLLEAANKHAFALPYEAPLRAAAVLTIEDVKKVSSDAATAFATSCWVHLSDKEYESMDETTYQAFRDFQSHASAFEQALQCELIREIVGNPYQPISFDSAWNTPLTTSLAQKIYSERSFSELPLLAEALEAAGCRELSLLGHCRSDKMHVRGCWVLDLLLGQ
jgi:hypothetical protein